MLQIGNKSQKNPCTYLRNAVSVESGIWKPSVNCANPSNRHLPMRIIERPRSGWTTVFLFAGLHRCFLVEIKSCPRKLSSLPTIAVDFGLPGDGKWITSYTPSKNLPWRAELLGRKTGCPSTETQLYGLGWKSSCPQYGQDGRNTENIKPEMPQESRSLGSPFPVPWCRKSGFPGYTPSFDVILKDCSETSRKVASCIRRTGRKWILEPIAEQRRLWSKPLISSCLGRAAKTRTHVGKQSIARPDVLQLKVNSESAGICDSMWFWMSEIKSESPKFLKLERMETLQGLKIEKLRIEKSFD